MAITSPPLLPRPIRDTTLLDVVIQNERANLVATVEQAPGQSGAVSPALGRPSGDSHRGANLAPFSRWPEFVSLFPHKEGGKEEEGDLSPATPKESFENPNQIHIPLAPPILNIIFLLSTFLADPSSPLSELGDEKTSGVDPLTEHFDKTSMCGRKSRIRLGLSRRCGECGGDGGAYIVAFPILLHLIFCKWWGWRLSGTPPPPTSGGHDQWNGDCPSLAACSQAAWTNDGPSRQDLFV